MFFYTQNSTFLAIRSFFQLFLSILYIVFRCDKQCNKTITNKFAIGISEYALIFCIFKNY